MSSKDYFDEVASRWDEMRSRFFPESVRETALRTSGAQAGQLAADLGAGSGFITEALLNAGLEVIAVDESEAMLKVLQEKFAGLPVTCRVGEAAALPLPTNSVRYAFANMYLHHVESPADAIREMAHIIEPGGMVLITDLDEHPFTFLREEHHDRWMGFKREAVADWFQQAGLQEVVVDCVGSDCCAVSTSSGEQAAVSIFIASGVKPE